MIVIVNGTPRELSEATTVAELVATAAQLDAASAAVARNGEVVPRSAWDRTELADGDRVELLTAAQGG